MFLFKQIILLECGGFKHWKYYAVENAICTLCLLSAARGQNGVTSGAPTARYFRTVHPLTFT